MIIIALFIQLCRLSTATLLSIGPLPRVNPSLDERYYHLDDNLENLDDFNYPA